MSYCVVRKYWLHQGVTFSPFFATTSRFRPHQQQLKLNSRWRSSRNNDDTLQRSFLHSCPPWPPSLFRVSSKPGYLFKSCWLFNTLQTTRWWPVDSSALLLTQTSNTDKNKSADTTKKSISDGNTMNLCTTSLFANISVGGKRSWCTVRCYITVQQELSVIISASINMLAYQIIPISSIIPNVCIEVFQKDREFVRFNLLHGITSFFHEFQEMCTWVWTDTCFKHRKRSNNVNLTLHTLPPDGIHSSTQPASWDLQAIYFSPDKLWEITNG